MTRCRADIAARVAGCLAVAVLCGLAGLSAGCGRPSPAPGERTEPAEPPRDLRIFILAGQSNMSGRGRVDDLPADLAAGADDVYVFANDGRWRRARAPVDRPVGDGHAVSIDEQAGVGPGLGFARTMLELRPGPAIGLVPCAKGGTPIARWARSDDAGRLYGSCVERVREASRHGRITGILWYQGEGDAYTAELADAWPAAFAVIVESLRTDLRAPDLPVVFAQLATVDPARQERQGLVAWDRLKRWQATLEHRGVAMVRTEDLPLADDGIHLTTAAQIELGRRFARTMHALLAGP